MEAGDASVVLGTGEPPPTVTVRPLVGVLAEIRLPAAIGFRRGARPSAMLPGFASPAMKLSKPLVLPYQVSVMPSSRRAKVNCCNAVGEDPTCIVIFLHVLAKPLASAHSGRAAEVEKTVSAARRT